MANQYFTDTHRTETDYEFVFYAKCDIICKCYEVVNFELASKIDCFTFRFSQPGVWVKCLLNEYTLFRWQDFPLERCAVITDFQSK